MAADDIDNSPNAIAARRAIAQLDVDAKRLPAKERKARRRVFFEQHRDDTCAAEFDAQAELISIEPTTIAGVIALLRYASAFPVGKVDWMANVMNYDHLDDELNDRPWEAWCFRHIADALSKINGAPVHS